MGINEVVPEQLAELFHHYHEALARESADEALTAWKEMPPREKNRLIAAARLALLELGSIGGLKNGRQYFARAGEAEWGC